MGRILRKALPKMIAICSNREPPFAASIDRSSNVAIRELFV